MIWLLIIVMISGYFWWWLQSFIKDCKCETNLSSCLSPRFPLGHYAKPFGILVISKFCFVVRAPRGFLWWCSVLVLSANECVSTDSPVLFSTVFLVVCSYFALWRLVCLFFLTQLVISFVGTWNRFLVGSIKFPVILSSCGFLATTLLLNFFICYCSCVLWL